MNVVIQGQSIGVIRINDVDDGIGKIRVNPISGAGTAHVIFTGGGEAAALVGELSNLETSSKTNVVSAINELVDTKATGAGLSFSIVNGIVQVTT